MSIMKNSLQICQNILSIDHPNLIHRCITTYDKESSYINTELKKVSISLVFKENLMLDKSSKKEIKSLFAIFYCCNDQ